MNRLVLRFGNQRADTILEHRAVLEELGHVWWGWWSKAWERVPSAEEWRAIQDAMEGGAEVGLFDRRALRFHMATCNSLRLADGTARVQSPETSATPGYYSDEFFPAWFRISDFRDVSEGEFRETFGFVPLSEDRTLFWDDPSNPPESHVLDLVETSSSGILHVSDLHFGEDFGFRRSGDDSYGLRSLEDIIVEYVRDSDSPVGVVVVSGDLITRGTERYFRDVTSFFDSLLGRLGLTREHVVVVPGHHDLWLDSDAAFTYSHDYAHELGYRDWHDNFFSEQQRPIERVRLFDCSNDLSLAFVQVNSARLRERETMEFGYVGRHRYQHLLRALTDIDRKSLVRFFVMHHHVAPVPGSEAIRRGRPISVTVDAGQIIEDLQRFDVSCILHGHQHLPFVGALGRMSFDEHADHDGQTHPLAIVGCGSTGARAERLSPSLRANTFGLYQPVNGVLNIRFVEFSPEGFAKSFASATAPLPGVYPP